MADTTRNTFAPTKRFEKLLFQRNKNVLDSELNELQDIIRVNSYLSERLIDKQFKDMVTGKTKGAFRVFKTGVLNEIKITAGEAIIGGYLIVLTADHVMTIGTTTAGRYSVWVTLSESEIDAVGDSTIAVSALGETTRRRKLNVTFSVALGDPPANTGGEIWEGGTQRFLIAHIWRDGTTALLNDFINDRRINPFMVEQAFDRNRFWWMRDDGQITWDQVNNTIIFKGLKFVHPACEVCTAGNNSPTSAASFVLSADGAGVGFVRTTGSQTGRFRRLSELALTWGDAAEDVDHVQLKTVSNIRSMSDIDQELLLIAYRDGNNVVLRTGVVLTDQDTVVNTPFEQPRVRGMGGSAPSIGTTKSIAMKAWCTPNGKPTEYIDTFGFRSAHIVDIVEEWGAPALSDLHQKPGGWNTFATTGDMTGDTVLAVFNSNYWGRALNFKLNAYTTGNDKRINSWTQDLAIDVEREVFMVLEFWAAFSETFSTTNSMSFKIGMTSESNPNTETSDGGSGCMYIFKDNGSTSLKWIQGVGGLAITIPNTAALAAETWFNIRLVYSGKAATGIVADNTGMMQCYYNGIIVSTTTTTTMPGLTSWRRFASLKATNTQQSTAVLRIGRMSLRYRNSPARFF